MPRGRRRGRELRRWRFAGRELSAAEGPGRHERPVPVGDPQAQEAVGPPVALDPLALKVYA